MDRGLCIAVYCVPISCARFSAAASAMRAPSRVSAGIFFVDIGSCDNDCRLRVWVGGEERRGCSVRG